MTDHPDLLALLRGELTNRAAAEAGDHLDVCADCRDDLAQLATAHAMLSRSARTLGEPGPSPRPADPAPLPRLLPPRRPRHGRTLGLLAAAAAVAAIAGTVVVGTRSDDPTGPVREQVTATLDPVDGAAGGRLLMTVRGPDSTDMTITTSDLPRARHGQFYEAWLLDPATRKMLPLGAIGPSGRASFEVDDRLLGRYSAVDISLEADDGDPQHSVTSVLRAPYDAPRPRSS
jgi:Anti-sigma-K factor rskA, C-terminal